MGLATFIGGVHPYEGKELSMEHPITVLQPNGVEMVFPLSQHIGAPAKPLVAVGDEVLVGQIIAEAGGFISANVVSSVSGKVKKIEPRRVANGSMVNSIIIENDKEYRAVEGFGKKRDYTKLSKDEIRKIVKDAGIVGLGGAAFPTHVKLSPKNENEIDYIIVNGAECEPYLTSDYRLMMEEPEKLVEGLKIILRLFPNAKGIIGIENNKPEAIAKIKKLVQNESKIEVVELYTKYPQGGERSLIFACTGRKLNSSLLPADVGCIVDNTDTVISIYNAVAESTTPQHFKVRTGTNYQELIEAAGGFKTEPKKVLSGGPMMGQALFTLDIPVTKSSSSITTFVEDEGEENPETPCIKCGRCIDVCPSYLVPVLMMDKALNDDTEGFEKLNGMECVECGSCAYVCPAKRPLTQGFKYMRQAVAAKRRAEAAKKEGK